CRSTIRTGTPPRGAIRTRPRWSRACGRWSTTCPVTRRSTAGVRTMPAATGGRPARRRRPTRARRTSRPP
ncbi:MAG: hypothetical protein AVDCRST_MAG79-2480, partial [uncultured Thermoleophilia bacterium]